MNYIALNGFKMARNVILESLEKGGRGKQEADWLITFSEWLRTWCSSCNNLHYSRQHLMLKRSVVYLKVYLKMRKWQCMPSKVCDVSFDDHATKPCYQYKVLVQCLKAPKIKVQIIRMACHTFQRKRFNKCFYISQWYHFQNP